MIVILLFRSPFLLSFDAHSPVLARGALGVRTIISLSIFLMAKTKRKVCAVAKDFLFLHFRFLLSTLLQLLAIFCLILFKGKVDTFSLLSTFY